MRHSERASRERAKRKKKEKAQDRRAVPLVRSLTMAERIAFSVPSAPRRPSEVVRVSRRSRNTVADEVQRTKVSLYVFLVRSIARSFASVSSVATAAASTATATSVVVDAVVSRRVARGTKSRNATQRLLSRLPPAKRP